MGVLRDARVVETHHDASDALAVIPQAFRLPRVVQFHVSRPGYLALNEGELAARRSQFGKEDQEVFAAVTVIRDSFKPRRHVPKRFSGICIANDLLHSGHSSL